MDTQSIIVTRKLGKQPLAVVTGGSHRVGRMITLELARLGYAILIHYNKAIIQAETLKNSIFDNGGWADVVQGDLKQAFQIDQLFQKVDQIGRPLQVWVNSAAIMPAGDILKVDEESWSHTMNLNLRAALFCSIKASERMQAGGSIVNVSDYFAQQAWRVHPLYGLSKAALEHLTRILASRLAPRIRVNALGLAPVIPPDDYPENEWQGILSRSPGKRAITGEEIGRALEYLLTNEYISGEILSVTGDGKLSIVTTEIHERPA